MSPKAIAVAGLSAIAIAASGCSGDSDAEAEANVRSAFKKRFATAPSALLWYDRITGMDLVDGRLEIATDLEPATDDVLYNARAYAEAICQGVTNLSFEGNAEGIETTSVTGIDGVPLAQCAQVWPDADSDAEADFLAAFKKKFGVEPQYHHITGIKVRDGGLVLRTDFAPKSDFDAVGAICGEAYGVAIETGAIDSGEFVNVKDRDGVGILSCA